MSCFSTESELVDLLDGRLDGARELALHAHLETCADCRRRAEAWGRLVPVMRRLAPAPPAPLRARRMEVEIERLLAAAPAPRLPSARRALAWSGLVVAAAAVVALVAMPRGDQASDRTSDKAGARLSARVTSVVGVARVGGATLRGDEALAADAEVVVEAGGVASLALAGASLKVEGPAHLTLGGDVAHVALGLDQGTLTAAVAHRATQTTFVVSTREGRVEVRGTRFTVHAEAERSTVAVEEGRVAVFARGGLERSVSAGERAVLDGSGFVAPPAPAALPPALAPTGAVTRSCEVQGPACDVTARRARASMRAGNASQALRLVEGAMAARFDCTDVAAGASSCRDELRYLRAEALRQDGRFDAAVAAYKALDHHGAPAAMRQNAFYAAAQLEQRLGRASAARADFERALAAAPAGALREEALLGAMQSAAAAGEGRRVTELAERYLAEFPAGLGSARARAIVAGRSDRRAP